MAKFPKIPRQLTTAAKRTGVEITVITRGLLWKCRLWAARSLGGGSYSEVNRAGIEFGLVADLQHSVDDPGKQPSFLGGTPQEKTGLPPAVWGVAALVVVVIVAVLIFAGRHKAAPSPRTLQPPDAYAAHLPLTQLAMSESESLSGGKLTYLDGHVQNTGDRTVTGITVQVVFANDVQMPPSIETVPLTLIRMKEPYIDTQPVSAAPIRPGEDREFRLTFEAVPDSWNQQMPEVRVIHTDLQ